MKLLIGIPTNRDWKPDFCMSLIRLTVYLAKENIQANIRPFSSSCLSESRQNLLDSAIKEDYTHILFIDDDMVFKPEAFALLKKRDKDFIAPNIMLRDNINPMTNTLGLDGKNLSTGNKTGIERILTTGLAFALIKLESVKSISSPHFCVAWMSDEKRYYREDLFFCRKLHENGVELYIDHDASRHIWHIEHSFLQEKFNI